MLARSAKGLYWLGRYLERAQFLCRHLELQVSALVDRPVREIQLGWRRIYGNIKRIPPGGILMEENEDITLADSYTLAGDLTFELTNPDCVLNCFEKGRENARQMRHCINNEMWKSLNLPYLQIKSTELVDIWRSVPEDFYSNATQDLQKFFGVADATMYRGQGWNFLQLGRFVERTQLSISLLLAHISAEWFHGEPRESDISGLLRIFQAFEDYNRLCGNQSDRRKAFDMLVTDSHLPASICRSSELILKHLSGIIDTIAQDNGTSPAFGHVTRSSGRLIAICRNEWLDTIDGEETLMRAEQESGNLHVAIDDSFFNPNDLR